MMLHIYLRNEGISVPKFATELSARGLTMSHSGLRKWVYRTRIPGPRAISKIQEVTNGKVGVDDWIEEGHRQRRTKKKVGAR